MNFLPRKYLLISLVLMSAILHADLSYAQKLTDEERVELAMRRLKIDSFLPIFENIVREMGQLHEVSIPVLVEFLRDEDEDDKEKINAIYILGRMGPKAKPAVGTIVRILTSRQSSNDVKAVAAGALGRIGHNASTAIPALENHLRHEDRWVRAQAERALKRINTRRAREVLTEHYAYMQALEDSKQPTEYGPVANDVVEEENEDR